MSDRVEISIEKHVALVRMNRPKKHNALDHESFEALIEAGETLARNKSVRAVVLAGAGESFCAGIDMSVFDGDRLAAAREELLPRGETCANFYQRAALVWRELPVPVIAAVHGVAYGAGLQIAMAADVRVAAPSARLSIMEVRWGIIPDMGLSVTMRHVVPADRIRMLAYTGKIVDGTEALKLGLITELAGDPLMEAGLLATAISQRSPDAIRAIKALLNESLDEQAPDALRREADLQRSLLGSPNNREAVMANLHKREPHFQNPQ
ncbi:MAG TPA: crotonase/enoyl-CoA hydratase family protein [Woeseiaceae bacterium]|nr:crotonase/enoyl-CoA hydratase family protein [Woeseiaceae bacterium]